MQRQPPQAHQEDRQAVFTRLVHQHAHALYRVAWSTLRHAEDAEDCVQEALLKLYRGDAWLHMESERAFLASVVWRVALDRRRMRPPNFGDPAELPLEDARPTPEAAAVEGDERALLRSLIDELPEDLRETLLLSAMDEMNSREIGEVMAVPEGTVRTRLMRARAELRERWNARRGVIASR